MGERLAGVLVGGRGKVTAAPDMVVAKFTANATAANAADATAGVNSAMSAMVSELAAAGVAETDRQTAGMQLSSWREQPGRPPTHHATQRMVVRLRDMAAAGEVVQVVLSAGGDNAGLDDLKLDLSDPEPYREQARERAMADARRKAEQLAGLAGRAFGPVLAVREAQGYSAVPMVAERAMAMDASGGAGAVSVEAGELEVSAELEVEFGWAD